MKNEKTKLKISYKPSLTAYFTLNLENCAQY